MKERKVLPLLEGNVVEFAYPDGKVMTSVPMIMFERGSDNTKGMFNWQEQLLHLEDGRVFKPVYPIGDWQEIRKGEPVR